MELPDVFTWGMEGWLGSAWLAYSAVLFVDVE